MSILHELRGAFPTLGPLPYLIMAERDVRAAIQSGLYPADTTWFHATYPDRLPLILEAGIIPSCWWGGDSCCVFGFDLLEELPQHRRSGWIVEVRSPALAGQLKAWWVPPAVIRGAWHEGVFWSRAELSARFPANAPVTTDGCYCDLSELVSAQQRVWRSTLE